jgi:uncharacterized surface protein with fasciclin (FAS1) repeats
MSLLISCQQDDSDDAKIRIEETVFELIESHPDLRFTETYIENGEILTDALNRDSETWTFFAPTDEAWFDFLDYYDVQILNNVFALNLIGHHAISGAELTISEIDGPLNTLWTNQINRNDQIEVDASGAGPTFDGSAGYLTIDSLASNGIVNIIDAVLLPSSLVNMKGTNAQIICVHHEMEFFYKGIVGADIQSQTTGNKSYLEILTENNAHTVFVTSDTAFRAQGKTDAFYSPGEWYEVLQDRFIMEVILPEQLVDGATFTTLSSGSVRVFVDPAGQEGVYLDWDGDYDPENPDVNLLDTKVKSPGGIQNSNGNLYYVDDI